MDNPFQTPGSELLGGSSQGASPSNSSDIFTKPSASGPGGGSRHAGMRVKEEAAKQKSDQEWEKEHAKAGEEDPVPIDEKPKSSIKKVGWVKEKTFYHEEAEVFAEAVVPESQKHLTRIKFELFHKRLANSRWKNQVH